ncbi:MAG: hypothetical protein KA109_13240 [Saprospiraceae bacterium]|jgi:hypothetical protein|nr:hypothetical protein [Saprospiraceae bacterium]MBK6481394.1 hypothetical protein [Saprospiraceae bacterium]MBK6815866.1 hypothetical protein [Saprospiraceae bacterium]MBK7370662.1 hypothetical protein [Saprospiraceae bacterium]MBK7438821.1 hypothetical protein [Saprospiraceae bacterium]
MKNSTLSIFLSVAIIISLIILTFSSCTHDPFSLAVEPDPVDTTTFPGSDSGCDTSIIYFNRDILPIFRNSCAITGCHDARSAKEGYVLTDYAHIVKKGLISGKPKNSNIYSVITASKAKDVMPPAPYNRLTSKQISLINRWITGGLTNDSCVAVSTCDTTNITFTKNILPIFEGYCTGCHGSITSYSGIRLDGYKYVVDALKTGRLLGSLKWEPGYIRMPLDLPQLIGCDIKKIEIWVRNGSVNN